jgi:uncharacterized protein (DUF1697 family)
MQTFVSLLRGVNMTGHNSVKMTELASLCRAMGCIDPQTFIQSGNIVFSVSDNTDPASLTSMIEEGIRDKWGYNVPAMIRTVVDLENIMSANPYLGVPGFDPARMAVIFLHEEASQEQIERVAGVNYPPDLFSIKGKEIYTWCPDGFGRTKIYTNFFEKKMKVTGTARNWKTVKSLLDLASEREKISGGKATFVNKK